VTQVGPPTYLSIEGLLLRPGFAGAGIRCQTPASALSRPLKVLLATQGLLHEQVRWSAGVPDCSATSISKDEAVK
jgi:hypothetical protein